MELSTSISTLTAFSIPQSSCIFCEAFLGIRPHWILFRKFFRVKPQPSASNPRVVRGAGIQMREDTAKQYLAYKLIDSNADWKARWFYVTNHHPGLPKPSGR
jgi:hypothetical protein